MIKLNKKYALNYTPDPKKILSAMREKQNILAQEYFNGTMPMSVAHAYEVAWRDACLYCLQEIADTAEVAKMEKIEWQEPARSYLERVYNEIMLDNALSPYVNYQE
jgi:hypothetical protein